MHPEALAKEGSKESKLLQMNGGRKSVAFQAAFPTSVINLQFI
jgi:hypothetical protein